FVGTALVAVLIGIGLGTLTSPGSAVSIDGLSADDVPDTTGSWLDILTGAIPRNPIAAFADGKVLQIVILAVVVGIVAIKFVQKVDPFVRFTTSVLEIVQKALWWVIRLSPTGVLGLIGNKVADYGWGLMKPLSTFTVDVCVGCAIVLLVVYPLLL